MKADRETSCSGTIEPGRGTSLKHNDGLQAFSTSRAKRSKAIDPRYDATHVRRNTQTDTTCSGGYPFRTGWRSFPGRSSMKPGCHSFPGRALILGGLTDAAWINLCRVAAQRTQASFWPEPEIYRTGPAQVLCTLTSSVYSHVAAWTAVTRMGVLPALPEPAN